MSHCENKGMEDNKSCVQGQQNALDINKYYIIINNNLIIILK